MTEKNAPTPFCRSLGPLRGDQPTTHPGASSSADGRVCTWRDTRASPPPPTPHLPNHRQGVARGERGGDNPEHVASGFPGVWISREGVSEGAWGSKHVTSQSTNRACPCPCHAHAFHSFIHSFVRSFCEIGGGAGNLIDSIQLDSTRLLTRA